MLYIKDSVQWWVVYAVQAVIHVGNSYVVKVYEWNVESIIATLCSK